MLHNNVWQIDFKTKMQYKLEHWLSEQNDLQILLNLNSPQSQAVYLTVCIVLCLYSCKLPLLLYMMV